MDFDLRAGLRELGPGFALALINAMRPTGEYVFARFLPEENRASYHAEGGNMTVRPTMAGLSGMDSPYSPGGQITLSTFLEKTAKITNQVDLPEAAIRALQEIVLRLYGTGQEVTLQTIIDEILNFTDAVVVQAHLDTMEFLRGQVLNYHRIDWTFNNIKLRVDYGVEETFRPAKRTGAEGYGAAQSTFWADDRKAQRALNYQIAARIIHPQTMDMILENPANNIAVVSEDRIDGARVVGLRKVISRAGTAVQSTDLRDAATFIVYDREGEIINPAEPEGDTLKLPFQPVGKISYVGSQQDSGYRVGQGATQDPGNVTRIGYTHIAPTVENGGRVGRWADVRNPDNEPWKLQGRGVTNGLPVLESTKKSYVNETEVA